MENAAGYIYISFFVYEWFVKCSQGVDLLKNM